MLSQQVAGLVLLFTGEAAPAPVKGLKAPQ
jgi:hypothetical protein